MSELNHLRTIIRRTEDSLLVSKDPYEIERIQAALRKLRVEEQKKNGVRTEKSLVKTGLYFFSRKLQPL